MAKILDPVLDYFIQIPLSEGNILKFLMHKGFQVSTVQNSKGDTKNVLFYYTQFPRKTVQFDETHKGVENFLYSFQKTFFIVLGEYEMTFLLRTPLEEHGISIGIQDERDHYSVRKVQYSGEKKVRDEEDESLNTSDETELRLATEVKFLFGQQEVQKFFMNFVQHKKFCNIEELDEQRAKREMVVEEVGEKGVDWS